MKRFLTVMLACACALMRLSAQDADSPFKQVVGRMSHVALFQASYPQEKAYLHFDNTGYFQDERMYFKCYVTRTDKGTPTDISRVLYVDLMTPSGSVVKSRKLRLENGEAHGDFLLDSLYSTGFYEVRAYTRYMLNFGDDACFSRVFPVFNKPKADGDYSDPQIDRFAYHQRLPERLEQPDSNATLDPLNSKRRASRGYTVNVYPEGGKMVRGLFSRVAFTVSDPDHHPVEMAGEVLDARGNTLAIAVSNAEGKGIFDIVPTTSAMTMVLTTPDQKKISFEMPEALDEGLTLLVDPVPDVVDAKILSTPAMTGKLIGMTVMNNGNIYLTDTITLSEVVEKRFSRKKLRPGVNQLTLFDGQGHIHAERLFFVCPPAYNVDTIGVDASAITLKPCGKVRLDLHTLPNAHLSLSAMDYGALVNGPHGNINTYMLLSSDIAGYIPHPDYYFEADDEAHRLAADSLMRFNGWRRYDWEVMADVTPWRQPLQSVEDALYVYGHLRRSWKKYIKNNPVNDVDMTLYIYNDKGQHASGETRTDSTGFYAFRLPDDAYGDFDMQILTKIKDKLKTYSVTIDRQFQPKPRFITTAEASPIVLPEPDGESHVDKVAFERVDQQRMRLMQTGKAQYTLSAPLVKARKPRWNERRNPAWDEYNARLHANIYYDMKKAAEAIEDRGEVPPRFDEWLASVNPMVKGTVDSANGYGDINDYNYGGRNIIWVVNNQIYGVTGNVMDPKTGTPYVPEIQLHTLSTWDWPTVFKGYIDELRSMYIWSDQQSKSYAVVVYMFTEPYVSTMSKKGRRITTFHGYDRPTKFQTDDYERMPVMVDDYRRTLWWEPDLVADSQGNASVEFYNNSTCKQLFVSAEGMTHDGHFVTTK